MTFLNRSVAYNIKENRSEYLDFVFLSGSYTLTPWLVGLGGLGVTCSPRDPRFAGSNPTEVVGFFSGRKNPEHKSSGRDFKLGVPSLRFQAR